MSANPTPTPEKKNHLVWWFLGLVLAAVVILGLGGLLAAWYLARTANVQVIQTGDQVEVRTPAGELKVARAEHVDPGLPVYPGATLTEPGATIELAGPDEYALYITAARYRTSDPIEKVDAWYQEKLGPDFGREGPGKMRRKKDVVGIAVKSSDIAYISEKDNLMRVVSIERKGFSVEIAIARISKQETQ
jgi:hypothetical protein